MSSADLNATAASLLGFLYGGPKTGWDLVQAVEGSVGYFWNITRSQVYRELKTLAERDLVAERSAGARDKVPYAITAKGRQAFDEWIAREPGPSIMRMPLVLSIFFGRHLDPALLHRYIEKARLEHVARLEEYEAMRPEVDDEFRQATLDLGITYEKTVIAWLEGLPWRSEGKRGKKKR
jgi:DNA-binding PadR family transcriptional regulator